MKSCRLGLIYEYKWIGIDGRYSEYTPSQLYMMHVKLIECHDHSFQRKIRDYYPRFNVELLTHNDRGYFAASNAFQFISPSLYPKTVIALIGCGPVGLCALISALSFQPAKVFAIDSVPSRLALAHSLGAEPLNFLTDKEHLHKRILEATDGHGVDAVMEVVGNSPALRTAYDIVRPWGTISSVGVHNGDIPISGSEMYNKNIRIQFGRCPVRAMFPKALELLKEKHHLLGYVSSGTGATQWIEL